MNDGDIEIVTSVLALWRHQQSFVFAKEEITRSARPAGFSDQSEHLLLCGDEP
jgi:hypothetical protein